MSLPQAPASAGATSMNRMTPQNEKGGVTEATPPPIGE